MTAVVAAIAALAPWLVLAPLSGAAAVAAHAVLVIAACHGAGLAVAAAAGRRDVHPALAAVWGLAAIVGVLGLALAAGRCTLAVQAIVVYGCAAGHTAVVALRSPEVRARLAAVGPDWGAWLVPAAALVVLGAVHALGAAGDLATRPFDDDGHVLGQLARLRDTGALADAFGYPRRAQLGGQLVLAAVGSLGGDVALARLLEGLALPLALALACARIQLTDAGAGLWALLLVVAAFAYAFVAPDPAACWTAVALIVALHVTLADDAGWLPLGLVAGALATLRLELAPLAVVALALGRRWRAVAVAAAVVAPYAFARWSAWSDVPASVRSLVSAGLPWAGVLAWAALAAGVVWFARRRVATGWWLAPAGVLVLAALPVCGTGMRFAWPLVFGAALVATAELARARRLTTAGLVVALLLCAAIFEGRTTSGRVRWVRRAIDAAENIAWLRHAAPAAPSYTALLRAVPPGARVATWVGRPERLPYAAGWDFVDLRTPRIARLRVHRWTTHPARLAQLVAATGADYLLLERDDARARRIHRDLTHRLACAAPHGTIPACADDLESLALAHPVVAELGGLVLLRLR